jgi:hypothetical protein
VSHAPFRLWGEGAFANVSGTEENMIRKIGFRLGFSTLALAAAGLLIAPAPGMAQTEGSERRGERRDDRQGARDTRQSGRDAARDAKAECKEGDEKSRAECRQEKRDVKQDARGAARDIKTTD